MVTLYQSTITARAYWATAIGATLLILAASVFVTDRIRHEHKAYAKMDNKYRTYGRTSDYSSQEPISKMKRYAEEPTRPETGFGQGHGHRKTLALIWLVTSAMVLTILTLAALRDHSIYKLQLHSITEEKGPTLSWSRRATRGLTSGAWPGCRLVDVAPCPAQPAAVGRADRSPKSHSIGAATWKKISSSSCISIT